MTKKIHSALPPLMCWSVFVHPQSVQQLQSLFRYHTGICLHGDCWQNLICCSVMMQPALKSGLLSGARSVLETGRGSVSVCGGPTFQRPSVSVGICVRYVCGLLERHMKDHLSRPCGSPILSLYF